MPFRHIALPALGLVAVVGFAAPAMAHPHVFVDARMEIVGDAGGRLQAIRNVWRFDELFSSSVLFDFDKNGNGELDHDELDAVGETVRQSIAEWSFYTFATNRGRDIELTPPTEIRTLYQNGQLLMFFEMKPAAPVDLKTEKVTFTVYDESFFVAFDFADAEAFQLLDLPKTCSKAYTKPDPDEDAAAWMNSISLLKPDQTIPDDGVDYSQTLAIRVDVQCAG